MLKQTINYLKITKSFSVAQVWKPYNRMKINKLSVKNVAVYLYVVCIFSVVVLLITEMIKQA